MLGQKKATKEKAAPVAAPRNISAVPCAPREERSRAELAEREKKSRFGLFTVSRHPALFPRVLGWLEGEELLKQLER